MMNIKPAFPRANNFTGIALSGVDSSGYFPFVQAQYYSGSDHTVFADGFSGVCRRYGSGVFQSGDIFHGWFDFDYEGTTKFFTERPTSSGSCSIACPPEIAGTTFITGHKTCIEASPATSYLRMRQLPNTVQVNNCGQITSYQSHSSMIANPYPGTLDVSHDSIPLIPYCPCGDMEMEQYNSGDGTFELLMNTAWYNSSWGASDITDLSASASSPSQMPGQPGLRNHTYFGNHDRSFLYVITPNGILKSHAYSTFSGSFTGEDWVFGTGILRVPNDPAITSSVPTLWSSDYVDPSITLRVGSMVDEVTETIYGKYVLKMEWNWTSKLWKLIFEAYDFTDTDWTPVDVVGGKKRYTWIRRSCFGNGLFVLEDIDQAGDGAGNKYDMFFYNTHGILSGSAPYYGEYRLESR